MVTQEILQHTFMLQNIAACLQKQNPNATSHCPSKLNLQVFHAGKISELSLAQVQIIYYSDIPSNFSYLIYIYCITSTLHCSWKSI